MYGFPAIVTGSAFCAPMLPSSQVTKLTTRYTGLARRCWKSLTSRTANPLPAAVAPVPNMVM